MEETILVKKNMSSEKKDFKVIIVQNNKKTLKK